MSLFRELDRRFLAALESGEIEGDILTVDEEEQGIKAATPVLTIFDVK